MSIKRDGRTIDTLENYRWPFLVGGESDGKPVAETDGKSWDYREIKVGEDTYVKRTWVSVGAPIRIIFYLDSMWPKGLSWGYAVNRRIYQSHPDLEKLPDIEIGRKKDQDAKKA